MWQAIPTFGLFVPEGNGRIDRCGAGLTLADCVPPQYGGKRETSGVSELTTRPDLGHRLEVSSCAGLSR